MVLDIKDGNGTDRELSAVVAPNGEISTITISKEFLLAVQMGQVAGVSTVDKFGLNPQIATGNSNEDVWEGSTEYIYDADGTAPIVSLVSNSASDTQAINVQGLDINGNFVSQNITLTGTTRVPLTTPLWRVFRMSNEGVTDLAGTCYCYTGTGGVPSITLTRALISNGNNQTLMALYTIPKGKVGFLVRGEAGIEWEGTAFAGTEYARIYYKSRRLGKVFTIKKAVTLTTTGSAVYQDHRSFSDIIPDMTDIKINVPSVSAVMGIWSTFDILLMDQSMFSNEYLTAIGQQELNP